MDEYVFLLAAKLKADRVKLAREQRTVAWAPERERRIESGDERRRRRTARVNLDNYWRMQS